MKRPVAAGDGHDRRGRGRPPRWRAAARRARCAPPIWISATSPASSAAASAACSARAVGARRRPRAATSSSGAPAARCASSRGRTSAPTPSTAVCTTISSSADAVEALGERLADAADRLAAGARARAASSSSRASSWRAIELNSLPSAANSSLPSVGHLDREVAAAERARGVEQALDLGLQRARDGEREREARRSAKPSRIAMTSIEAPLRPPPRARRAGGPGRARRVEAGPSKPVDAQLAAADLDLAPVGQALRAGVRERRRQHVARRERTTTSDAGHALDQLRVLLAPTAETVSTPGGAALGVEQAGARGRDARRRGRSRSARASSQRHDAAADAVVARELVRAAPGSGRAPGLDRLRRAAGPARSRARPAPPRPAFSRNRPARSAAPRRAARRSCPARSRRRARTRPAATTIIGRMTRTMKKTVRRLRKLIRGTAATGQPSRATATIGPTAGHR